MVPTAVAVGTMTLWHGSAPAPIWWPAAATAVVLAVAAQRATAITRWLGLGQSLMGTVQAVSWLFAGPWAAVIACLALPAVARRRDPVILLYNISSLVIMSCAGWWGFHWAGGDTMTSAQDGLRDVAVPVAVGALAQLLTNVLLIIPGLSVIRGHRLPALTRDAVTVLRAGWANQVLGSVVLALATWGIHPRGLGLLVAAVPLMVHMAVLGTIQEAETGQTRALRTLIRAAKTSDPYLEPHGARVAEYAKEVGRHLRLGPHQMESLDLAARLHDIGFVALPLQEGEREPGHGAQGARMVEGLPFLDAAARLIRDSHAPVPAGAGEGGDPHPIELRVLQVADAVDALVTLSPAVTVEEICAVLEADPQHYDARAVAGLREARPVLRPHDLAMDQLPEWWRHDIPTALRGRA